MLYVLSCVPVSLDNNSSSPHHTRPLTQLQKTGLPGIKPSASSYSQFCTADEGCQRLMGAILKLHCMLQMGVPPAVECRERWRYCVYAPADAQQQAGAWHRLQGALLHPRRLRQASFQGLYQLTGYCMHMCPAASMMQIVAFLACAHIMQLLWNACTCMNWVWMCSILSLIALPSAVPCMKRIDGTACLLQCF